MPELSATSPPAIRKFLFSPPTLPVANDCETVPRLLPTRPPSTVGASSARPDAPVTAPVAKDFRILPELLPARPPPTPRAADMHASGCTGVRRALAAGGLRRCVVVARPRGHRCAGDQAVVLADEAAGRGRTVRVRGVHAGRDGAECLRIGDDRAKCIDTDKPTGGRAETRDSDVAAGERILDDAMRTRGHGETVVADEPAGEGGAASAYVAGCTRIRDGGAGDIGTDQAASRVEHAVGAGAVLVRRRAAAHDTTTLALECSIRPA